MNEDIVKEKTQIVCSVNLTTNHNEESKQEQLRDGEIEIKLLKNKKKKERKKRRMLSRNKVI